MYGKRLIPVAALFLVAALLLSGCSRNPTVVTVNGQKISRADYYGRLEVEPIGNQPAGLSVIDQMTNEVLAMQLAKEKGVTPTEAQIKNKIDFQKKEGDLMNQLNRQGVNLEVFKRKMRVQQALINVAIKGINIPEKDVKAYYDSVKNGPSITKAPMVLLGAVICNSEAKIKKADEQIKRGTEFATVSRRMSDIEALRGTGGTIGWISQNVTVAPEDKIISDNAFKLKVNQVCEPFKVNSKKGPAQWVILKALDRKPGHVIPYDEVKDQMREQLALNKSKVNPIELLAKKRKSSVILVKGQTPIFKAYARNISEEKKAKTSEEK